MKESQYPVTEITVAGLQVCVYGLDRLPTQPCNIALVSLLHPRLAHQGAMAPLAAAILNATAPTTLCLTIDQRNHGTREIEPLRNNIWRQGNERHAVDLFAFYQGTALDLSAVLDFLPSYLFPDGQHSIDRHIVAGVSLGGHASWVSAMHDPRVEAAAVVIGCPDFCLLVKHRAEKSQLQGFAVGASGYFPATLLDVVRRFDPAAVGVEEAARRLRGKKVLCLSGALDKLVPYSCSKGFIEALKAAGGVDVDDRVFEGAGHECTPAMVQAVAEWVAQVLAGNRLGEKL